MQLNKNRIQQRFARAAATYDKQAVIQHQVADRIMAMLNQHMSKPPEQILEIGCCTGLLTTRLHSLFNNLRAFYVNDLVPDFQGRITERLGNDARVTYLAGDIEQLDIPDNLDLVVSSSTLHWLEDLPSLFHKLANCLTPGGTLCFSIYGTGNLAEILEVTGIGLSYHSKEEIQTLVSSHFDILACEEDKITLYFCDPLVLLNHLRETGVNALDTVPWTKSRLECFQQEYTERFSEQGKVPLTYHPIYVVARKKTR